MVSVSNNMEEYTNSLLKSISNICWGEPIVVARIIDGKPGLLGTMNCLGASVSLIMYTIDYSSTNNSLTSDAAIFIDLSVE